MSLHTYKHTSTNTYSFIDTALPEKNKLIISHYYDRLLYLAVQYYPVISYAVLYFPWTVVSFPVSTLFTKPIFAPQYTPKCLHDATMQSLICKKLHVVFLTIIIIIFQAGLLLAHTVARQR